ncbi:MAG: protein kinase [Sandaracinaceae bacterium]
MRVCTICGAKWRGEPSVCPLDGGPLDDLPDALVGRTIGGRYSIVERVGAGGMGTVYRARHELVGRDVAIKFLGPDLAVEETNRRRFLREAKAANRIDHEHIIDITDYGETDDGLVYLVMEYLDGQPLSAVIGSGPMSAPRALEIAKQMSAALARAHELDVVHRDIKPDNVYVLPRHGGGDFIKLLDFGLAKMRGEIRLTASGTVFGTPEYMAPEQARGAPLTGKADLYAMGCVLYEMLAGRPPFQGATPDLILKHIREVPAPPSTLLPSALPPGLDDLIMRLLEKNPADRHSDAYHLYEEIRRVAESLPRHSQFPTIREEDFVEALRTQLPERGQAPSTVSSSAEAWDKRIARFQELTVRAHANSPPDWLRDSISSLERWVGELARRRGELDRSASAVMQSEEEIRKARLRMGRAIDVLARDESRAARALEEINERLVQVRDRLSELEAPLLEGWSRLPKDVPTTGADLDPERVSLLRDVGKLAAVWVEAQDSVALLLRDMMRREREREDLSFQAAQLKGRLSSLSAEGDLDLEELREKTRTVDSEIQRLLDQVASTSERLVVHFQGFPNLTEALREVGR